MTLSKPGAESARWRVLATAPGDDAIEISQEGRKVVVHLGPVTDRTLKIARVEPDRLDGKLPDFLCWAGRGDTNMEAYDTFERDAPVTGSVRRALLGEWSELELRADGTFEEAAEDCNKGTWRYADRIVTLRYTESARGGGTDVHADGFGIAFFEGRVQTRGFQPSSSRPISRGFTGLARCPWNPASRAFCTSSGSA